MSLPEGPVQAPAQDGVLRGSSLIVLGGMVMAVASVTLEDFLTPGASDREAEARRNSLGNLAPEPGRQRTPLLPVQRTGGHSLGDLGPGGRLKMAH